MQVAYVPWSWAPWARPGERGPRPVIRNPGRPIYWILSAPDYGCLRVSGPCRAVVSTIARPEPEVQGAPVLLTRSLLLCKRWKQHKPDGPPGPRGGPPCEPPWPRTIQHILYCLDTLGLVHTCGIKICSSIKTLICILYYIKSYYHISFWLMNWIQPFSHNETLMHCTVCLKAVLYSLKHIQPLNTRLSFSPTPTTRD